MTLLQVKECETSNTVSIHMQFCFLLEIFVEKIMSKSDLKLLAFNESCQLASHFLFSIQYQNTSKYIHTGFDQSSIQKPHFCRIFFPEIFLSHFFHNSLLSSLDPNDVAEIVVDGVRANQEVILIPRVFHFILFLKS